MPRWCGKWVQAHAVAKKQRNRSCQKLDLQSRRPYFTPETQPIFRKEPYCERAYVPAHGAPNIAFLCCGHFTAGPGRARIHTHARERMSSARLPHGSKHLLFGLLIGTAYGIALSGLWRSKESVWSQATSLTKASHSKPTCGSRRHTGGPPPGSLCRALEWQHLDLSEPDAFQNTAYDPMRGDLSARVLCMFG